MLTSVELQNFRNYSNNFIEFNNKITVITGKNASGKTNILEAIFTSLFTKSFRASDIELITNTESFFRLKTTIDSIPVILHYTTTPKNKKTLKVNAQLSSLRKNIGKFPVVLFEPNTILLFSLTSTYRRRYLDMLLYQLDARYVEHSITYYKTLKQRNTWLRSKKIAGIQADPDEQIYIYNIQLATAGAYITKKRKELLNRIKPLLLQFYEEVSGTKKKIDINFNNSNVSDEDLLDKIQQSWFNDRATGRTLLGPHREDFSINFSNKPISTYASRGELRSVLLALKFAELDFFTQNSSNTPLLLLDDVFSELDESRQKKLIKMSDKFQTIITATHLPSNIKSNFQLLELPL